MAKEKKKQEQDEKEQSPPFMETDDWLDADARQGFEEAIEKKGGAAPKRAKDKQDESDQK
jgi:hypothetical protein